MSQNQVAGADFEKLLAMHKAAAASGAGKISGGDSQNDVIATLLQSYQTTGLQASKFAEAQRLLTQAFRSRKSQSEGSNNKRVYLAYTSNLISSGLREVFASMVKSDHVDAIVTTAGGIEEDYIKCLGPTMVGDFALQGAGLRGKGLNRVGNLLIPNNNYVDFENFMNPTLKELHKEQLANKWTAGTRPSDFIQRIGQSLQKYADNRAVAIEEQKKRKAEKAVKAARLKGKEQGAKLKSEEEEREEEDLYPIDLSHSVGFWSAEKNIPVFCPAITDGSIGDMMFFYNFNNPGMIVDPLADVERLQDTVESGLRMKDDGKKCGDEGADSPQQNEITLILLGGGLPKHHLMRAVVETLKDIHHNSSSSSSSDEDGTGRRVDLLPLKMRVVNVSTSLNTDGSVSAPSELEDRAQGLLPSAELLPENSSIEQVSMHADATLVFPLLYSAALKSA